MALLSQHISIIEVGGAYAHLFEKFLDFLSIKALIITDFDSVDEERKVASVDLGSDSSNGSIKHFLQDKKYEEIKNLPNEEKILKDGNLYMAYQVEENGYHARSFEDSFIHLNKSFIKDRKQCFKSLKKINLFDENVNAYDLANKCIDGKTLFATEILYYGDIEDWETPKYIEEGLLWLSKK